MSSAGPAFSLYRLPTTLSDCGVTVCSSCYSGRAGHLHTFHCSANYRLQLALAWDSAAQGDVFLGRARQLLDRPENVGLSGPKSGKPRTGTSSTARQRISKATITYIDTEE